MRKNIQDVVDALTPLFNEYDSQIQPASVESLEAFKSKAVALDVPSFVINQLIEFYTQINEVPSLDSLTLYPCDDNVLFEWWDDSELWIGARDSYILRWSTELNAFCVGDASNVSFGKEYEFNAISDAILYLINVYAT